MTKPGKRARPRPVYVDGTWWYKRADEDQIIELQMKAYGGALRSRHADWRDDLFAEAFNAELAIPTKRGSPRRRPPGHGRLLNAAIKLLVPTDPHRDDMTETDARNWLKNQRARR